MTTIRIPQVQPLIDETEAKAAANVVASGWLTEGLQAAEFVNRLCIVTGSPFGVLAPNGTLALVLGMMALGIGPGDEVIVPDLTMAASAFAVIMTGATPIFVDVEPNHFQIDVNEVRKIIGPNTRAVMPVHLFGTAADMTQIMDIAARFNLLVIEDACQGIGVKHAGRHVGTFGDVGCFSFFADKTITTGEGGFVACRKQETYNHLRMVRNQGRLNSGTFTHPSVGYNLRMTDMQAAIGVRQLQRLPEIIRRKQDMLQRYENGFSDIVEIAMLKAAPNSTMVPFRCVFQLGDAYAVGAMSSHLRQHGIEPRGMFQPMHSQPCFQGVLPFRLRPEDYFISKAISQRGLMLPLRPTMNEKDQDHVIRTVRRFYG